MTPEQPNPASSKDQAAGKNVSPDCNPPAKCGDDFNARPDLDGKTDSGPEPDVFGREIPPQK